MKFPELASFDSDSVPHGLDALKIVVADLNTGRAVPYATIGEYLADLVGIYIADHVRSKITDQQIRIIAPEISKATDQQIQQIGVILGKDLTIPVPEPRQPILAQIGITSSREDAAVVPIVEVPSMWDRMKGWFNE